MTDRLRSKAPGGRLDWCCIGAQKAGTSTLYRLLRDHPEIVIPQGKEDPIFDAEVTDARVCEYLETRFGDAGDRRCGTVTPQYMSDPQTAQRLHHHAPDAQVVVLLRDPVMRALSHYKMSVLRQLETRTFDRAVADQLDHQLRADIDLDSEIDTYVVRGNYGWVLEEWFRLFPAERVLVAFATDLDTDPAATVARVQDFLGVSRRPVESADFRFNASPPPHRLSAFRKPVAAGLRRVGWDRVDPERRERISSGVERLLGRAVPIQRSELAPATERGLREYYAADRARLTDLLKQNVPWQ